MEKRALLSEALRTGLDMRNQSEKQGFHPLASTQERTATWESRIKAQEKKDSMDKESKSKRRLILRAVGESVGDSDSDSEEEGQAPLVPGMGLLRVGSGMAPAPSEHIKAGEDEDDAMTYLLDVDVFTNEMRFSMDSHDSAVSDRRMSPGQNPTLRPASEVDTIEPQVDHVGLMQVAAPLHEKQLLRMSLVPLVDAQNKVTRALNQEAATTRELVNDVVRRDSTTAQEVEQMKLRLIALEEDSRPATTASTPGKAVGGLTAKEVRDIAGKAALAVATQLAEKQAGWTEDVADQVQKCEEMMQKMGGASNIAPAARLDSMDLALQDLTSQFDQLESAMEAIAQRATSTTATADTVAPPAMESTQAAMYGLEPLEARVAALEAAKAASRLAALEKASETEDSAAVLEEVKRRSRTANSKSDFARALDMYDAVPEKGATRLDSSPTHCKPAARDEALLGEKAIVVDNQLLDIAGDSKAAKKAEAALVTAASRQLGEHGYADTAAAAAALARACVIAGAGTLNTGDAYVNVAELFPCAPTVVLRPLAPETAASTEIVMQPEGAEVVWTGMLEAVHKPVEVVLTCFVLCSHPCEVVSQGVCRTGGWRSPR